MMKTPQLTGDSFEVPTFLVDNDLTLADAVAEIAKAPEIALDTESNSLYVYQEHICVIQISTGKKIYIIDPVRINDMSVLNEITSNPGIVKYIHGADYDVGGLKRDFHYVFNNIFDTMIAAQYCNFPRIGMADLVEHYFGIRLEKKFTKSNWGERPISLQQLIYLCQDVQYLIDVGRNLRKRLEECDLTEEAELEFRFLEQRPAVDTMLQTASVWNIKGARALSPQSVSVLYELFLWREKRAGSINIPPFKILNNKTMIMLAELMPDNKDVLFTIKGITNTVYNRCGHDIMRAIKKGKNSNPSRVPTPEKKRGRRAIHWEDQDLVDALKKWRTQEAEKRGVHHLAVLPGHVLEEIARNKPASKAKLLETPGLGEKRCNLYCDGILRVIVENPGK